MNITTTKRIVRNPDQFSTRELHEALDVLVNDERFTEAQVSTGQARIEEVLNSRKAVGGRTYPAGTDIRDMSQFNRGIKVVFQCSEHEGIRYMSKDPFCSQWFPANELTRECEMSPRRMHEECEHTLRTGVWLTSFEYTNDETYGR